MTLKCITHSSWQRKQYTSWSSQCNPMDRYCCHVKRNLHNCVGNRRISSVPDGRSVGDLESWRYKPSFHFYRCMNSIFERWNIIYNRLYSLKDNTWVLTGQYPRYWPPNGFFPRSPKQGESGKSEKCVPRGNTPLGSIGWSVWLGYWLVSTQVFSIWKDILLEIWTNEITIHF